MSSPPPPLYKPVAAHMGSQGSVASSYNAGNPEYMFPGMSKDSPWNQKKLAQKYPALAEDTSADVVGKWCFEMLFLELKRHILHLL